MADTLNINHKYTSRITRNDCPIVPVITGAGNIKWVKIRPDVDVSAWLVVEWHEGQGRKLGVKTVRLAQARVAEGAMLLEEAYKAEQWPEGWRAYKEYLHKANTRTIQDKEGGEVEVQLGRPKPLKFPERLLPKAVFERRAKQKEREKAQIFEAPESLVHPSDADADAKPEPKKAAEPPRAK